MRQITHIVTNYIGTWTKPNGNDVTITTQQCWNWSHHTADMHEIQRSLQLIFHTPFHTVYCKGIVYEGAW